MQELTSSFDDVDKRLAIFVGLGAFLLSSLLCFIQGASFETYLIQGSVVALVFMLVGYAYGHWLRGLVEEHTPTETVDEESVEFRTVDAEHAEEEVVGASDVPETVIEEDGQVVPAENAAAFEMPELEAAPAPPAPAPMAPPAPAPAAADSGEDLPPPPVPSGV